MMLFVGGISYIEVKAELMIWNVALMILNANFQFSYDEIYRI